MTSLHHNHIVLHVKPQKQMKKILLFKQNKNGKQALLRKSRTHHQSYFLDLPIDPNDPNDPKPHRYLFHLKQLKSVKHLTLDLACLSRIPKHCILKILDSLRYLKGLTALHLELIYKSSSVQGSDVTSFYQALPIINNLSQVQIKFYLHLLTGIMETFRL